MNKTTFETLTTKFLNMTLPELEALQDSGTLIGMDAHFVGILVRGIKTGDYGSYEWLLQRHIGKVKDVVAVEAKPFILEKRDGTQLVMGAKQEEDEE